MLAGTKNKVIQQLARERFHILCVDKVINELQRSLADGDVGILEAINDGISVTLKGRRGTIRSLI